MTNYCQYVKVGVYKMATEMIAEKYLTTKGKETLFKSIEEYVDASIEWKTGAIRGFQQEDLSKAKERFEKAEEDLEAKLMALQISLV